MRGYDAWVLGDCVASNTPEPTAQVFEQARLVSSARVEPSLHIDFAAGMAPATSRRMNAIDLLKQQHREVEDLFEKIEKAEQPSEKAQLFHELASKLVGHDAIEREIFYPACEEAMGLDDQLGEALVEHGVVEFSLYQADQALGASDFDFKVKVLKELVEHHVEEEEKEFLPKAQKALGDEELESLSEEMEDAFEESISEDYHAPLFENLRQVLAGTLKPVPSKDLDDDEDERPSAPRKAAKPRKSA